MIFGANFCSFISFFFPSHLRKIGQIYQAKQNNVFFVYLFVFPLAFRSKNSAHSKTIGLTLEGSLSLNSLSYDCSDLRKFL